MARISSLFVPFNLSNLILFLFIQPSFQNTHYANENASFVIQSVEPCHIYGDPDIYGVGIRCSFYITWLTLFVAITLPNNDEVKNTRRAFNIVALAVLINTYISITDGSFAALEIFIVCTLVFSLSIFFLIPDKVGTVNIFDAPAFRNDRVGFGILSLIDGVFLCTQPWLYFKVLRQGSKEGCVAKIWLFKPINLYSKGWIIWLKLVAILSVLVAIFFIMFAFFAIGLDITKSQEEKKSEQAREEEERNEEENTSAPLGPWATRWKRLKTFILSALPKDLRLPLMCGQAIMVACVEMTIKINNIDLSSAPVTATGQLLPLLVGIFSAVSVLWVSAREEWPRIKTKWNQAFDVIFPSGPELEPEPGPEREPEPEPGPDHPERPEGSEGSEMSRQSEETFQWSQFFQSAHDVGIRVHDDLTTLPSWLHWNPLQIWTRPAPQSSPSEPEP